MDSNNNNIYTQIVKYTGIFGSIQGISVMTGVIRNKITALLLGTMGMDDVAAQFYGHILITSYKYGTCV